MDGTPLSSHSSTSEQDPQSQDNITIQSQQDHSETQHHTDERVAAVISQGDRLLSEEEQVTLITESMLITSADEEKLLLLNRNTELRRVNKELIKLNEDWDHIYRSTTLGLEQRVGALEQESATLKQLNSRLLLKGEHEQSKREYYQQTLLQELKKNQHLQEYIQLLGARLHHADADRDLQGGALNGLEVARPPEMGSLPEAQQGQRQGTSCYPPLLGSPPDVSHRRITTQTNRSTPCRESEEDGVTLKEVRDLKEQLKVLRCQTQIYEADYRTEHKDRQRMVLENKKLRRKADDTRQQMALLKEQLKVYEDDFRKERSDKQVLQRLLMKNASPKDPVLVHRCNNDHDRPAGGERQRHKEREKGGAAHRPPSGKHCDRHVLKAECPHPLCQQRHADVQSPPFSADYN